MTDNKTGSNDGSNPGTSAHLSPVQAADLLRWYREMGVDVLLDETARNRFAEPDLPPIPTPQPKAPMAAPTPTSSRPIPQAVPPSDASVADARQLARNASSLEELEQALTSFNGCNLKFTAKNTVFADGDARARLMLVGEAPGRDEDIQGLPFVGRSGQLLDKMLTAIAMARSDVYIANVVPWRPPGNRTPTPLETEICRPFIERQIELVAPQILVLLGGAAAKQLLNTTQGIMKLRGRWREFSSAQGPIRTMATFHPAYLLRAPGQKRLAWRDFLAIKEALDGA